MLPLSLALALAVVAPGVSGPVNEPDPEPATIATPTVAATTAPLALAPLPTAPAPPPLAGPRDPGPFSGNELAAATIGTLLGDALVAGAGYGTLQLFASGSLEPTATNFRHAAYALGVSSLLVPPLTAVLLARWARADPASGAAWKALLLATVGEALALGAGYLAAPQIWVVLPVQLVTVAIGTTVGLHWGPRASAAPRAVPDGDLRGAPPDAPAPGPVSTLSFPICPAS